MPDTVSFLDSVIPGVRCQKPVCQSAATAENAITVRKLLYDGWICRACGTIHTGALSHWETLDPMTDEEVIIDDPVKIDGEVIDDGEKKPNLKDRVLGKKKED